MMGETAVTFRLSEPIYVSAIMSLVSQKSQARGNLITEIMFLVKEDIEGGYSAAPPDLSPGI
ncbi:MAG: hypothetical protein M5U34_43745 [Chloroflexi bacterium]|nr:hypothetical protein [Chloroflexota bacterium]